MRKIFLLLIGINLLLSCQKDNLFNEDCQLETEVTVPEGFEINSINTISGEVHFKEIQFINDKVGYILGASDIGGYTEIFKTNDIGNIWTDLDLSLNKTPINMFFINEDTGFVSYYGLKGNLYKTIDGGSRWNEKSYQNLNGNLYHIQKDRENNLYAILSDSETFTVLVKSIDNAESWQIINDSKEFDFRYITFSFKLFEDKIYISGKNNKIIVTDLNGNQIQVIHTGQPYIWDFDVIDYSRLVLVGSDKVIKSSDGGLNWSTICDKRAKIIDFENSESGLFIYSKSNCPVDYRHSNGVIAYTNDEGKSWIESQESTNIITSIRKFLNQSYKASTSHYTRSLGSI